MKKQFRFLTALLSVLCLIFSVFPVTVWAGSSRITIDDSSSAEKINNTIWNNPSGDVISQDGKLIFPAESKASVLSDHSLKSSSTSIM